MVLRWCIFVDSSKKAGCVNLLVVTLTKKANLSLFSLIIHSWKLLFRVYCPYTCLSLTRNGPFGIYGWCVKAPPAVEVFIAFAKFGHKAARMFKHKGSAVRFERRSVLCALSLGKNKKNKKKNYKVLELWKRKIDAWFEMMSKPPNFMRP